jgi:hypothetical protein
MSNKADKYKCQLVIVDENSKRIASLPFDMEVTKAAMDENSESIEEDASLYQQYTEAVQANLANEATARQTADNTLQGNINSEASTRASADSNLQAQINQLVAPSGEAPSAAEVQNARIGADGVTYDTLGEAIRGQVTDLKSALNELIVSGSVNLESTEHRGYFIADTAEIRQSSGTYAYSGPIAVERGKKYKFVGSGTTMISAICSCDANGDNRVSVNVYSSSDQENFTYTPVSDGYIVVSYNYVENYALTYSGDGDTVRTIMEKIDSISDLYENLYDVGDVEFGINWTGASAPDKAVIYIPVEPSTSYYVSIPVNSKIPSVAVIEKATNTGAGDNLHLTDITGGDSAVITTTANTNYLCFQFSGVSTIIASDFDDYAVYCCEGTNEIITAFDKVARSAANSNKTRIEQIVGLATVSLADYEVQGKFVNDLGLVVTSAASYAMTKPIPVRHGYKYTFTGTGSTIVSAISVCDKDGNIQKSISVYSDVNGAESFTYKATADGYIILSYNYVLPHELSCEYDDSIGNVSDLIDVNKASNLFDASNVVLGKNWTGSDASNRAVVYIKTKQSTAYKLDFTMAPSVITGVSIIEKSRVTGDSIRSGSLRVNNYLEWTTSAKGNVLCIQFEGSTTITRTHINGVRLYVCEADRAIYNNVGINEFDTFRDLVESGVTSPSRVGKMYLASVTDSPVPKYQTQGISDYPYLDIDETIKQYDLLNGSRKIPNEYILNNLPQEEIDFTPANEGFNRTIVFKDIDDRFFIANQASDRLGQFGDARYDVLEMTTDFKTFTTVLRCADSPLSDGIPVPGMTYVKVTYMKQFADGSYILCINCNSLSENKSEAHFYKLSADLQTLTHCNYVNLDGNTVEMVDEFNNGGYDWSCFVTGSKALATTYGSRNPSTDYGRVWYTEDNGQTWKQVFQTNTHLQDGAPEGVTITKTHTHGVMIDPYSGRLFVIAGEDNDNIFWNDHGINANNDNWEMITLRKQSYYNFCDYIQVVNGYALDNCLLFGSDNGWSGGIYRVNKLKNGDYSSAEMAHEVLPNKFLGTCYCAGELSRKDSNSPLLMCITRESAMTTEEANEQLNRYNLGRVIATYDGFNFTEIWKDDTYGVHDAYLNGAMTTRNYAYCTRGMSCWILKNGDAVIKYSGRDYYYFGADPLYSLKGYSNGSDKVRWIKNAEKYL